MKNETGSSYGFTSYKYIQSFSWDYFVYTKEMVIIIAKLIGPMG